MAARFLRALTIGIAMLVVPTPLLRAGGPRTIAGTSYFDPAVKGAPLTWNQGAVSSGTAGTSARWSSASSATQRTAARR